MRRYLVRIQVQATAEQLDAIRFQYPQSRVAEIYDSRGTTASGAGTELKQLLNKLWLTPSANCRCDEHVAMMNLNGIQWCKDNIESIVGWLDTEARRVGYPFSKIAARALVRRAIKNAEKKR